MRSWRKLLRALAGEVLNEAELQIFYQLAKRFGGVRRL
jgi:hypothetical protein